MRKRDLPLPADFITDAVSVMDPPSRGGMGLETAEHRLLELRYHPALAHDAATWAWARHQASLAAAG